MAKASVYVRSALLKVKQIGSEQPIPQTDAQDVLTTMNDMLNSWAGAGVDLGFTTLTDLSDEVTVPDYASRAIKFNLAVEIADEWGREVSASTAMVATQSFADLLNAVITVTPSQYPSTLPVGSGNECGYMNARFYPGNEDQATIVSEINEPILVEDDTES